MYNKVISGIIGHAIGDAIGVPIEQGSRKKLQKDPITSFLDYPLAHPVKPGSWSDDTSMVIATIESFIKNNGFDNNDIMNNFSLWLNQNYFTPDNICFGSGSTCRKAIYRYDNGEQDFNKDNYNSTGNGSLMRVLPIAYYAYYNTLDKDNIYNLVNDISSLTHPNELCVLGSYIYVLYIIYILSGNNLLDSYNLIKKEDYSMFSSDSIEVYNRILKDNIYEFNIDEINSEGYVLYTLEASLWSALNTNNYKDSIIKAINLGGDSDSTGAVTGGITGTFYGYESIPDDWLESLLKRDYLEEVSNNFYRLLKR